MLIGRETVSGDSGVTLGAKAAGAGLTTFETSEPETVTLGSSTGASAQPNTVHPMFSAKQSAW
jgi:hypothetical protein